MPDPIFTSVATLAKTKRPLLLRLLGIHSRPGKRLAYLPTKWGWTLLIGFIFLCGSAGFMEYTMQPQFCTSCHLMEPYHDAWSRSAHKDVNCIKCHFEPGLAGTIRGKFQASTQLVKYITGTWGSKPHAQVSNASCTQAGCHNNPDRLNRKLTWSVPGDDGGRKLALNFNHTPHLSVERGGKQLRCVSCHAQTSRDKHMSLSVETCFVCHFNGVEQNGKHNVVAGCQSCHEPPKTIRLVTGDFDHGSYINSGVTCDNCHRDSIVGSGEVTKQSCWTCHNTAEQVARFTDTEFIHREHITEHKLRCTNCHAQIQHSLKAKETASTQLKVEEKFTDSHALTSANCGECHQTMHAGPKEMYSGTGGIGVPDMPSPMSRAQVDCIACHRAVKQSNSIADNQGQTLLAVQASCTVCHAQKYDGTLDQWKQTVTAQLARATAAYERSQTAAAGLSLDDTRQVVIRRLLNDADHNIRLVLQGHGVHNVNYATAVLNVAVDRCNEVERLINNPAAPLANKDGGS